VVFSPFFVLRQLKTPLGNTTESSRVGSPESDTNHSDLTLKATSVAESTERNCSPKNTLTGNRVQQLRSRYRQHDFIFIAISDEE
jgi:hypothetical protein